MGQVRNDEALIRNLLAWVAGGGSFKELTGATKQNIYGICLKEGIALTKLGKHEEALTIVDLATKILPECADAWFYKGSALLNLGKYGEAILSFDGAIKIKDDYADAWYARGHALANLEKYEDALASFQRVLEINSHSANAWTMQGVMLWKLGKYEDALVSYQSALRINPNSYNDWTNQGVILKILGRYEEALASYQNALKLDPNSANTWSNQGVVLEELGRYEEALTSHQRALKLDPNSANVWNSQGATLQSLRRYEEGLDSFKACLKLDPNSADGWNNLGAILANLGRNKEALANYQHALKIDPSHCNAWINRGLSINVLYGYDALIKAYDEAFEHIHSDTNPKDWGYIQHHIGRAHYQEGINQLLNKGKSPQTYYDLALTSYHEALKTLTRERFCQLRLETLLDLIKVHLAQKDTDAAYERQHEAFDIFGDLLNGQPDLRAKKRLKRKYSSLRQFDVDLFIARGDNIRALEAAELNKNEGLMLLLSALDEQTIQLNYDQMRELLTSDLTSETGIIYWHLSPDNLTTFILTTADPQPLLWESGSSSEHPPQRAYRAQQFQTWLKEWDIQYRDYSTNKWTETDPHPSGDVKEDERKNHPWRKNLSSSLNQLRQILDIDKICDRLPSNLTHLILIPHRDLHRFPLHTLFLATNKLTNLQGCSYLPSIQIGLNLRERAFIPSYSPLLNIADPKTAQPALEFARIESALVRHLHHPHTNFEGESADLTTIKNALSKRHATFNFTGHATYDPDNPEVSALALTDGLLTAQEIWAFDLSSYNLVNLAACETAITGGKIKFSDQYIGLSSAFLHARAANILGTLWKVDESANTWFTIYFYQQLLAGKSPAIALIITQRWMQTLTWQNLADWLQEISQLPHLDSGISDDLYAERAIVLENEGIIGLERPTNFSDPYYWEAFTLTGRG
jgi:tetratricopeptide (TPR) repeat protein